MGTPQYVQFERSLRPVTGSRAPWKQPFVDLLLPRPDAPSDWLRQVAHRRQFEFDRIRQFLARSALAMLALLCMLVLDTSPWAFAAPAVALFQGAAEIYLEKDVRGVVVRIAETMTSRGATRKQAIDIIDPPILLRWWLYAYLNRPLNPTGVLGGVACVLLLLASTLGTHAADALGWVKVGLLVVSLLYVNSGLSGPFLEGTAYEANAFGEWMRRLRPYSWLILGVGAAGLVHVAHLAGAWPPGSLPYAYLACALPYALGLRIREHDRVARASGSLIQTVLNSRQHTFRLEIHRMVSPLFKGLSTKVLAHPDLSDSERLRLEAFFDSMREVHTNSREGFDLGSPVSISLETTIADLAASQDLDSLVELHIERETLGANAPAAAASIFENARELLHEVLNSLTFNAAEAYTQAARKRVPFGPTDLPGARPFMTEARHVDGEIVVRASDALDLISDEVWSRSKRNLATIRNALVARGGRLTQSPRAGGGKTIEARWPATSLDLLAVKMEGLDSDEDLGH